MSTTNVSSNDARKVVAEGASASLLNPFIGSSAADTCAKVEEGMAFLYELFTRDLVCEDMNPGLTRIVQTVWAAVQFEREVAAEVKRNEE